MSDDNKKSKFILNWGNPRPPTPEENRDIQAQSVAEVIAALRTFKGALEFADTNSAKLFRHASGVLAELTISAEAVRTQGFEGPQYQRHVECREEFDKAMDALIEYHRDLRAETR